MKVGDKLYCHNNALNVSNISVGDVIISVGKVYVIDSAIGGNVCIKDGCGRSLYFNYLVKCNTHYSEWFYTITDSEHRKLKLEKLNESRR